MDNLVSITQTKQPEGGVAQSPRSRVLRAIRAWIAEGTLTPGDRVPAERVLAARLDVSRDTVRAAMEALEAEQTICRAPTGARVVGRPVCDVRTTSSHTVAVVTTLESRPMASPRKAPGWESWLGAGVTTAVYEAGLNTLLLHPDHLIPERLIADRLQGLIMLHQTAQAAAGAKALKELAPARIPTVICGEASDFPGYDTVYSDHEAGAFELTSWLIRQGRRRILRLWEGGPGDCPTWLKLRNAGHERAMREHGLEVLPVVTSPIAAGVWPDSAEHYAVNVRFAAGFLVEHLTGNRPVDAIMAASDGPADFVTGACRLYGKQPGRDVLVTGYDNYWQESPSRPWEATPPAATMDKLNERVGRELVQLLLDRSTGRLPPEPQHRLVCPKLVTPSVSGGAT